VIAGKVFSGEDKDGERKRFGKGRSFCGPKWRGPSDAVGSSSPTMVGLGSSDWRSSQRRIRSGQMDQTAEVKTLGVLNWYDKIK